MATGYTIYIENGKITNGKDFLLLCAQKDNYEDAKRSLEKVTEISLDEAKKTYENRI